MCVFVEAGGSLCGRVLHIELCERKIEMISDNYGTSSTVTYLHLHASSLLLKHFFFPVQTRSVIRHSLETRA